MASTKNGHRRQAESLSNYYDNGVSSMQPFMQFISFMTLLIFIPLNSIPSYCYKKHFGETLPFTMMLVPVVMELMQFITGTFYSGTILLLAVAVAGLILIILKMGDRKFRSLFFSSGFVAFLVVFLFVFMLDFQRNFSDFDEFWHWGMMIKESLRLDRFYCVPQSHMLVHKDYPPFLCMLEVFFSIIGGFSEGLVSASVHLFLLSIIVLPVAENMTDDELRYSHRYPHVIAKIVLWLLIVIFSIAFFDNEYTSNTILADTSLACVFGYPKSQEICTQHEP